LEGQHKEEKKGEKRGVTPQKRYYSISYQLNEKRDKKKRGRGGKRQREISFKVVKKEKK